MFAFTDIVYLIAIKLVLVAFLVYGLVTVFLSKRQQFGLFLVLTGTVLAGSYYALISDTPLLLWGIQGDEVTISAMYRAFLEGRYLSDFAFPGLPSFQPPLFFWFFAGVGHLFTLNSVMTARLAVLTTFLLFPIAVYGVQQVHWRRVAVNVQDHPGRLGFFLLPLILLVLVTPDAIITKPYQFVAAFGVVFWTVSLLVDLHSGTWSRIRYVIYGLSAGVLFMTYYLWLIYAAIAIALSGLFVEARDQFKYYGRLICIAVCSLLVALPYLWPLMRAYHIHGTEQWPVAFFSLSGTAWYMPMVTLVSWRGGVLLLGLIAMIVYRRHVYIRSLILMYVAGYVWYVMGLSTVLFAAAPLQEFKPFSVYSLTIFGFVLAFGFERWYLHVQDRYPTIEWRQICGTIGMLCLVTYTLPGTFLDDPLVQQSRLIEQSGAELSLIDFLQADGSTRQSVTPGVGRLYAFVTINSYLYYNQHNTHPAAEFSNRYSSLILTTFASTPAALHTAALEATHGPIERFILFKNVGQEEYSLHMHVDDFPNGSKDQRFGFDKDLFAAPYFELVYENKEFVVWDLVNTEE